MDTVNEFLQSADLILIATGTFMGTLARFITLTIDYRQNPSYPSAYFINIVTGFIAAALGAIAIPALLAKDFAAITFLALAVQHFRDIRKIEAESLEKLENTGLTKRGEAYIDGIAKTFESRNYISLVVALVTVFVMKFIDAEVPINIIAGIIAGFIALYLMKSFIKGKNVGDICHVDPGKIEIKGSELYVDDMYVTNALGSEGSRKLFQAEGIAVVLTPKADLFRITIDNYGQRQAMLFEAVQAFGVKRFKFTRKNFTQGKIIIAFVPIINDMDRLIAIIKKTPILESSRKIKRIMSDY